MLGAFWRDDSGVTLIEYGLVAGLVSIAILVTLGTLGNLVDFTFTSTNDKLDAALPDPVNDDPNKTPQLTPDVQNLDKRV